MLEQQRNHCELTLIHHQGRRSSVSFATSWLVRMICCIRWKKPYQNDSANMSLYTWFKILITNWAYHGIFKVMIVRQCVNDNFPTITSRPHETKIRSTRASGPRTTSEMQFTDTLGERCYDCCWPKECDRLDSGMLEITNCHSILMEVWNFKTFWRNFRTLNWIFVVPFPWLGMKQLHMKNCCAQKLDEHF